MKDFSFSEIGYILTRGTNYATEGNVAKFMIRYFVFFGLVMECC